MNCRRDSNDKRMGTTLGRFSKIFLVLALTTDLTYCAATMTNNSSNDGDGNNSNCNNCYNCENCSNCRNCRNCKNCSGCHDCEDSENLSGCRYCSNCRNCSGCINCNYCFNQSGLHNTDCRDGLDSPSSDRLEYQTSSYISNQQTPDGRGCQQSENSWGETADSNQSGELRRALDRARNPRRRQCPRPATASLIDSSEV